MQHIGCLDDESRDFQVLQRFLNMIDCSGECWEWQGARIAANGYGQFSVEPGKNTTAHRFAFTVQNGTIPEGLYVMHTCDNRGCVRGDHLVLGTAADNSRDMVAKGRHWSGPNAPGTWAKK